MITSLVLLTLRLPPTLLPASEESGTANYVNTTMTCNPSSTMETRSQHPTRPHYSVTLPWGPQWMGMQDAAGGTHLMNPVDLWQNWTPPTTSSNTNSLPPCSLVGYTQTHNTYSLPPVIPFLIYTSFSPGQRMGEFDLFARPRDPENPERPFRPSLQEYQWTKHQGTRTSQV